MKSDVIGILDIGIGNLGSIQRMLSKAGAQTLLVRSKDQIIDVPKLIIPGVGSFDQGMSALRRSKMIDSIVGLARDQKITILGICLGMQMLGHSSEEGEERGLGIVDATVKKFQFDLNLALTVPHMGWRKVTILNNGSLVESFVGVDESRFYFVHSYYLDPAKPKIITAVANYGGDFCAAFQQENIFGVQFHPEKSHKYGLALLSKFAEI